MPFPVKMGLSIAVAIVAIAGWFYMEHLGHIGAQRALAFLGPFMVIALWIFPEVARRPADIKTPAPKKA